MARLEFYPPQCVMHAQEVSVTYKGQDRGIHMFNVSSLSQPGREWFVDLKLSSKFDKYPKGSLTPKKMFNNKLYHIYSSDPGWKWWSCNYNHTLQGMALYPTFIGPTVHTVSYNMLHSELAVLELICNLGPGVLKTDSKFSVTAKWNQQADRYDFSEVQFQNS